MLNVNLANKQITSDDLQFSIDAMIEPRIHNVGDTNVLINGVLLQPKEAFNAGFQGAKSYGRLSIEFPENQEGVNRLVCYYGVERQEPESC
ncbi:hypothetical protein [Mesonia aquimarina]|uniref:hypothetical protein n=1 Tax=Mesonia aquimarina TaxID=1504967 RepID=UPI000EF60C43|nr:hypothetical protein [Mesonia aquimarina]